MKQIILLVLSSFIILQYSGAQTLDAADSLSRYKAETVLKACFNDSTLNKSYLLYSIADTWYLVMFENHSNYEEYYIKQDSSKTFVKSEVKNIEKPDVILEKAFDKNRYQKQFINFNSEYFKEGYELAQGNSTYFYLRGTDGKRYGECRLAVIVKPNPIDEDVYNYIRNQLLSYISGKNIKKQKKTRL